MSLPPLMFVCADRVLVAREAVRIKGSRLNLSRWRGVGAPPLWINPREACEAWECVDALFMVMILDVCRFWTGLSVLLMLYMH